MFPSCCLFASLPGQEAWDLDRVSFQVTFSRWCSFTDSQLDWVSGSFTKWYIVTEKCHKMTQLSFCHSQKRDNFFLQKVQRFSHQEAFAYIHTQLGTDGLQNIRWYTKTEFLISVIFDKYLYRVVDLLLMANKSDAQLNQLIEAQPSHLVHTDHPCRSEVVTVPK